MTSSAPDEVLSALAEPARWRLVELLAEQPRSVGVLAQLAGLRQPQATKHLQRLERAGVVVARRAAQRRYYVLAAEPLRALAAAVGGLADTVEANRAGFASLEAYVTSVDAERLAADAPGWADDRVFRFERHLDAAAEQVWRLLTEPERLASWWVPDGLRVATVEFEPMPGGRVLLEYREAGDADGSAGLMGRAEGVVMRAEAPSRLRYRLAPLLPDGRVAFDSALDFRLAETNGATTLRLELRITDSTVESADFLAGVSLGWNQSLDRLAVAVTHPLVSSEENQT